MTTSSTPQRPPATIVFIFGGSGDLNFRKLTPALYNLFLDNYLPEQFEVVGIGRSQYDNDSYRARLLEGVSEFSRQKEGLDQNWQVFAPHVSYLQMDGGDAGAYHLIGDRVRERETEWGTPANILFYMSVAPQLVPGIATNLSQLSFCGDKSRVRIVVEKPFGHDLKSARELNALLLSHFAEEQIYRIDHYLGKETVQNLLALRFANTLFEPIWNHNYVEYIQLTAAETVGLEGRGGYYEGSGALRDMIQNHLLQLLCMVAMEPPTSFEADEIRNKKVDVLHAIRRIDPDKVDEVAVRAQYGAGQTEGGKPTPAYREEEGVKPDSMTETYAAVTFFCDNWRWEGTPFFVRTGKHLAEKSSVITVQFRPAPHYAFPADATKEWQHNCLIISIQPDMNIRIRFQAKRPGQTLAIDPVEMEFNYKTSFTEQQPEAYETLLLDVMAGDQTLFMRDDQVDEAWQIVMPILDHWARQTDPDAGPPASMPIYAPGSWGPAEADKLVAQQGFSWNNE